VPVTAEELVAPLRRLGRPLPLVVLNTCHGGVEAGASASLAQALIQSGIPSVVAMQTTVSDRYASALARAFYSHLSRREPVLAARALAAARQELEAERQQRLGQGAPLAETLPEAATAALYGAGEERPLADFGRDKEPLREPPVRQLAGPVPQLAIGDLVGRRRELRACLRHLRHRQQAGGVLLSGIGGVGKSSVAGRVMQRLAEEGWAIASHSGRFDLRAIGQAVGLALLPGGQEGGDLAEPLLRQELDDPLRLRLLEQALALRPLLLVLDDFEQNLSRGGEAFLDPDTAHWLDTLVAAAGRGRLLLTCRHPLPGGGSGLLEVPLGPLSGAETRKLLQRLPGLRQLPEAEVAVALRAIGGHPRLLEFLDALLSQGQGRLPAVTRRLRHLLAEAGLALDAAPAPLEERLSQALALGARDVLLEELLAIARQRGDDGVLLQLAVSNLPLAPEGLARMLAGVLEAAAVRPALERLAALSLVVRLGEGEVWVHRWTAEGLARGSEAGELAERCRRAGDYRIWRVQNETGDLADGIEAVRNYLRGGQLDQAAAEGQACLAALERFGQRIGCATLAAEVLETLPVDHGGFGPIADAEARAHLALGLTDRAFARYQQLLEKAERLAKAEPDRADYQRDLSVSYNKMGDLYRALGQGEGARQMYLKDLEIAERLAKAEPDRADYQRDLSVSYNRMGDLYRALGQGEGARQAYQGALEIAERLAKAEPDRADYQRDLVVSLERIATAAAPPSRPPLERALAILLALEAEGRLAPADQPMIEDLRQRLAGRGRRLAGWAVLREKVCRRLSALLPTRRHRLKP